TSFWGAALGQIGSSPTQDVVLLLERLVPSAKLTQLGPLGRAHAVLDAIFDIGLFDPAVQARLGDPEVLGDLALRHLTAPGHCHDVTTELLGERLGHLPLPSSEVSLARLGVNR